MTSAADADVGTINHNEKVAIPLRTVGIEMGHPQGPIPAKTDNNTADGFFKKNIKPKRSKYFGMKFHWMKYCITQEQFTRTRT